MNPPVTSAILLAAGQGTRLRPYTNDTPKPLLPYRGQPALGWVLSSLHTAGVRRIVMVTGYKEEQVISFSASFAETCPDLDIACVTQNTLSGTAPAVAIGLNHRPQWFDQSFLISATDYLAANTLYCDFLDFHKTHEHPVSVSLKTLPEEELAARSSVAFARPESNDRVITEIVEKPAPGSAPSLYSANLLYVLPATIRDEVLKVTPSPRGECEIQSAINVILKAGASAKGLVQPTPEEWTPDLLQT
ncbi:MAG: NTP transferase domain-containing protein [Granulosicoccus sp.]|nr:NTP transferase domain-containing protein [Granulosicoccus sp.]